MQLQTDASLLFSACRNCQGLDLAVADILAD